jgi:hypothetical protein
MRIGRWIRGSAFVGALALIGCTAETERLGPPGKNMTGPVTTTSVGTDAGADETETGAPGDLPSSTCDPLADPARECGPQMTCDLTSRICVPASGTGLVDDPCEGDDECSPGLVCADGRCRSLCDAALGLGCADDQICSVAAEPIPGVCLTSCDLVLDDCVHANEACKRVFGAGGQVWAACVDNPGDGQTGDACELDSECAPWHLCTPAALHTLPCADEAAFCCAPVCDPIELVCFGLEPICYVLGIPGQETAGFCGVG